MNNYSITIGLAKAVPSINFATYTNDIEKAITYFNTANPERSLKLIETDTLSFQVILSSKKPITSGHLRFLRRFSIYLLQNSKLSKFAYNGGLFKILSINNQSIPQLKYDPDSSPEAWELFRKIYSDKDFVKGYDLDNLSFFEYVCVDKKYLYANAPLSYYNRLFALTTGTQPVYEKSGVAYYNAIERLSGDTIFNFNARKYSTLLRLAFSTSKNDDEFSEIKDELLWCSTQHHSLYNFSLMQTMGNLQGYKQKGLKSISNSYENLDRFDTLVYLLFCYYTCDPRETLSSYCKPSKNRSNGEFLIRFLEKFRTTCNDVDTSIYNFCQQVYLIDDRDFVDKLIKNGSKPIKDCNDIRTYIKTAKTYWEMKAIVTA